MGLVGFCKGNAMNPKVKLTWAEGSGADRPLVVAGEFVNFEGYADLSKQEERVRKLPVLRGVFDSKRVDFTPGLPAHAGWGSVRLGDTVALTFRLQLVPNVLYFLANPADPEIWKVMDVWAAAGKFVMAAEVEDGRVFLVSRDYKMVPQVARLRDLVKAGESYTAAFLSDAGQAINTGDISHIATTDIPAYPALANVQACIVTRKNTSSRPIPIDCVPLSSAGPMEAAVMAAMEDMFQPGKTRH